jgi:hypothetical protein
MALSLLEMVRKLIRQDTNKIGGPVGNWYGAVQSDLSALNDGSGQSWLLLELPGTVLPELEEFYQAFLSATGRGALLQCADGFVSFTAPTGTVQMLRAVVDTPKSVSANLQLELGGSGGKYAVYVDETLVRRGQGSGSIPLQFPPGRYVVAVLLQAPRTSVQVPVSLPLSGLSESPPRPVWQNLRTGYLDAQTGAAVNTLTWFAAATAGGYRVLRRTPTDIGTLVDDDGLILTVGAVALDDQFVVTIKGDHTGTIATGANLLSGSYAVGTVVRVQLDDDENTEVRCRLPLGFSESDPGWVGAQAAVGSFSELIRIARTGSAPVMEYKDLAVVAGLPYEYALQSVGLLDEAVLSGLSDVRYVVAGDTFAPGPIVFEEGFPKVINKIAIVRFKTPDDRDYQGVNVYYREDIMNGAADDEYPYEVFSVTGPVVEVDDPELEVDALIGFNVQIGDDPLVYTVVSNTAGAITLNQSPEVYGNSADPFAPPVGPAVGTALLIYKDYKVMTDFGLFDREDEMSFFAEDYGPYYFASFDRSRNEQPMSDAAVWNYTPADDVVNPDTPVGPVVAFRQLVAAEQTFFGAPYNDPAKYALVEIFAYSPMAAEEAAFEGVSLYYQRKGDTTPRVLFPVPQQAEDFPFLVDNALDAVLDDPLGVRSRFVPLERQSDNMWIRVWATDANDLDSDTLTFLVDFDSTPSITSLETSIDPSNNTVTFVAVVDDDTLGVKWYVDPPAAGAVPPEPTELVPRHVDTRSFKRVTGTVSLTLGQQKTLTLVPYAGWNTGASETEGTAGGTVTRNLVRTPRSYVTFDNKDENGDRSENTVRATFSVVPLPAVVSAGDTTGLSTVEGNTLLTDGLAAWTVNAYASAPLNHYYIRLLPRPKSLVDETDKPPLPVIRKVAANTATTMTLIGTVPRLAEYTEGYELLDGAVEVRVRTNIAVDDTVTPFLPTAGQEFRSRASEFYFEFFGTKTGVVQENPRLALVDPDSEARLLGFALSYDSTTDTVTASISGADDDAKYWRVYLRKGNWPTTTEGSQDGPVDNKYLRFSGSVSQTNFTFNVSVGTWYGIAIPENSFGRDGARSFATSVSGGPSTPGLKEATATASPASDHVELRYPIFPSTTGTVTITASRSDTASTIVSLVAGRDVQMDPSGVTPGDPDIGGFLHAVGEDIVSLSSVADAVRREWNYTVTFTPFGGGPTSYKTAKAVYWASTATPPPPGPATLTASVATTDRGICVFYPGTEKPAYCAAPHTRRITWNGAALNASFPSPFYMIAIDVSTVHPFVWNTLVTVPVSNTSWEHFSHCIYVPLDIQFPGSYEPTPGVFLFRADWMYRVRLVHAASGATVQTFAATNGPAMPGYGGDPMVEFEALVAYCQDAGEPA